MTIYAIDMYPLKIDKNRAIRMECSINISEFSQQWINIADSLYMFGISTLLASNRLHVTMEQYRFLIRVQ